jgi:transcriptional regulator with PAS, ATPase and Fis domain
MLLKYDYPGNVRELENIIERAVVISRGPVLTMEDLPFRELPELAAEPQHPQGKLKDAVEDLERRMIIEALEEAGRHQTRAAEILGLSERMLRYKLKKYGLK